MENLMSVWGISMMKDEADFVECIIPWMASQLDHLLIADNLSTDGTLEKLYELSKQYNNINIVIDSEVAYYQSKKMNALVQQAYEIDSKISWVLPFDADEMWFSPTGNIADTLNSCDMNVISCNMWHMVSFDEKTSINPLETITMRRATPEPFPSVAFRYHPDAHLHMGNHGIDYPDINIGYDILTIKHYQYRSFEHFKTKVINGKKAYDATDFPNSTGAHWREYGSMSDNELRYVWNNFMDEKDLVYDPW
jgi:glycosyltransferase involved in cell wall biosynthesis